MDFLQDFCTLPLLHPPLIMRQERLDAPRRGYLPAQRRAHEIRRGDDAHPAQVQPVRVEAGADGRVIVMMLIRVPRARIVEQLELVVREVAQPLLPQGGGKLRAPCPVAVIPAVIHAAAVMEHGKEPYHGDIGAAFRGQQQSVASHPPPVRWTMNGGIRPVKLGDDMLPEVFLSEGQGRRRHETQGSTSRQVFPRPCAHEAMRISAAPRLRLRGLRAALLPLFRSLQPAGAMVRLAGNLGARTRSGDTLVPARAAHRMRCHRF